MNINVHLTLDRRMVETRKLLMHQWWIYRENNMYTINGWTPLHSCQWHSGSFRAFIVKWIVWRGWSGFKEYHSASPQKIDVTTFSWESFPRLRGKTCALASIDCRVPATEPANWPGDELRYPCDITPRPYAQVQPIELERKKGLYLFWVNIRS
jgi:hypothetical protein